MFGLIATATRVMVDVDLGDLPLGRRVRDEAAWRHLRKVAFHSEHLGEVLHQSRVLFVVAVPVKRIILISRVPADSCREADDSRGIRRDRDATTVPSIGPIRTRFAATAVRPGRHALHDQNLERVDHLDESIFAMVGDRRTLARDMVESGHARSVASFAGTSDGWSFAGCTVDD